MANTDEEKKAKQREYSRRWRAANLDRAREQRRKSVQRWRAANPERAREQRRDGMRRYRAARPDRRCATLRYNHGITLEERDALLAAQGNRCANPGCRSDDPQHKHGWAVDHHHATGKIRAILCQPCNTALGQAKEDAARLRGLADYIEAFNPER